MTVMSRTMPLTSSPVQRGTIEAETRVTPCCARCSRAIRSTAFTRSAAGSVPCLATTYSRSKSPARSSSAIRCGPRCPVAPVTRIAISMLQEESAPARTEAVGEHQHARGGGYASAAAQVLEVQKAVGADGVTERCRTGIEPIFGNAGELQHHVPAGAVDAGRQDHVDFVRLDAVSGQKLLDHLPAHDEV